MKIKNDDLLYVIGLVRRDLDRDWRPVSQVLLNELVNVAVARNLMEKPDDSALHVTRERGPDGGAGTLAGDSGRHPLLGDQDFVTT